MTRYLIMLLADFVALPFAAEGKLIKGRFLRLGRPVIERPGVVARRIMWAHRFPATWVSGVKTIEFDDDLTLSANLVDQKPANWRAPLDP